MEERAAPRTDELEFITLSQLKEVYRLPPKWIKTLGEPDKLKTNPKYKKAAPMKLYEKTRVEAFIDLNRGEYEAMQRKREKQVETGLSVSEQRRQKTLAWASEVELDFHQLPDDLYRAAEDYFRVWDGASDLATIGPVNERGVIAMLRHAYSNYHELLDQLYRKVGRWEAYEIIRDRVNERACALANIEFGQPLDWARGEDKWLSGRWREAVGTT